LNEQEKQDDRFKAISEDTPINPRTPAWTSKVKGDPTNFGSNCYATNVIQSNRWPGAFVVSKGGKYCHIYIGESIKSGGAIFSPFEPPMIQPDPSSNTEE
jgi:hypothetical protein